jgi:outer membrane protein assembly factor BamB
MTPELEAGDLAHLTTTVRTPDGEVVESGWQGLIDGTTILVGSGMAPAVEERLHGTRVGDRGAFEVREGETVAEPTAVGDILPAPIAAALEQIGAVTAWEFVTADAEVLADDLYGDADWVKQQQQEVLSVLSGWYLVEYKIVDAYRWRDAPTRGASDGTEPPGQFALTSTPSAAGWTTFKGGPARTGRSGSSIPDATTEQWRHNTDGKIRSSPALVNGTVYVGTRDPAGIVAVDATTGRVEWKHSTDDWVDSPPTVAAGTVFIGDDDGVVSALDANSGAVRWTVELGEGNPIRSSPAVIRETVYVCTDFSTVLAMDATDGDIKWHRVLPNRIRTSPAVDQSTIVVTTEASIRGLDTATGDDRWTVSVPSPVRTSPAVADGLVFAGGDDGAVRALTLEDGDIIWSYDTRREIRSSPAVDGDLVIVGNLGGTVYAFDHSGGNCQWTHETEDWICTSPALTEDAVVVGSDDGRLYAIDRSDGVLIWHHECRTWVRSSPAVADGLVVFGCDDGRVYGLDSD